MSVAEQNYVFVVEWFDTAASIVRTYNLTYHTKDNTIQMYDIKNKKIFLKRTQYPAVTLKDIYVGAVLNVYSRQLKVADYSDQFTANKFQMQKGKTFALIKPDAYLNIGKIISTIENNGFTIGNLKMVRMTNKDAEAYYVDHRSKPYFSSMVEFMSSDLSVGIQIISENSVNRWKQLMGPQNPKLARNENPKSIRGVFGSEGLKNAVDGSQSQSSAAKELQFFFSNKSNLTVNLYLSKSPAVFNNCTCCVVKPHAISQGNLGKIVDIILSAGFEISAMQMFWLDRPSTEEFLEVYKNVVPQYNQMVEEFTNGPCVALEVRQQNAVVTFRELCGPHDSQMARTVRPRSIRALLGKDKVKNAVHCTDLAQDGLLEVEYFFNILQNK